jgi:CBS domain-containing protein
MPAETPLKDFLLADPPTVQEDEVLSNFLTRTRREHIEVLPVLAADGSRRVVGVLSPLDIFLHEVDRAREAYKKYTSTAQVGKAS